MSEILTTITNFGFPVVMCVLMWLFITRSLDEVKSTISNNTAAVQALSEIVRDMKGREDE